MSRSMSMARSREAAAGTPWKVEVAKKAGVQRRTSSRLMTQVGAEAFEGSGWWDDNPALRAFLDNEPGQKSQPVTLNRMRQQRAGQLAGREPAEGAKAESVLQFCSMTPAVVA